MIPVSAPSRVLHRLRRAPNGPRTVLHRGPHAIYLDLDGSCVGVVDGGASLVPCALRARSGGLSQLRGERAEVHDGSLLIDGHRLVPGRIVEVRVRPLRLAPEDLGEWSPYTGRPLTTTSVAELIGRGDGLTPYGDDVLCGWLATHRAAGVPTESIDEAVRTLSHRTTLLSATLLDCALHGEVLPEFAAYLAALGTPAEDASTAALESIGHTSGAGMLAGARWALTTLSERCGAAA